MSLTKFRWITPLLIGLALLGFLAGVAAIAYAGNSSRLWADDYCYSNEVQDRGLFNGTLDWYQTGGNRFSAVWMVALGDLFGPNAVRWQPAVVLFGWLAAAWLALRAAANRLNTRHPAGLWLVLSTGLVFTAAYAAPDRLQSIYWRMGTLHYSLPLVLFLLIVWLSLRAWFRGFEAHRGLGVLWLTTPLAFLAAGLSETYAAFQAGAFILALILVIVLRWRRQISRGIALVWPPLAVTLLAMLLMALSPANAWRQAVMPPPAHLIDLIPYSLRYSVDFVVDLFRTVPLPLAVYLLLAGGCGLLAGSIKMKPKIKGLLWGAAGALAAGFALVICAIAPSVYGGLLYPAGRALMVARFALLSGLGAAAVCLGMAVSAWLADRAISGLVRAAALLALVVLALYPLRAVSLMRPEIQVLQTKAARWDSRNAEILADRANGQRDLVVPEVDVVSGLEDMGPIATNWVNTCAAGYYGVASITALP